jgi:hypothetical protein
MKIASEQSEQTIALKSGSNRDVASAGIRKEHRSIGSRIRALLRTGEEGGAILEMAFTMPLLMVALTGMYSVTMALVNYEKLGSAVNNAAQQVAGGRSLITDPCATAATAVVSTLPNFTSTKFTYTLTLTDASGAVHLFGPTTTTSGNAFTCPSGAADLAQNQPAAVAVSYAYSWIPVYLQNLSGNITATATQMVY